MKILIMKSYGIGNAIMATPLIRALSKSGHDVYLLSDAGPLGGPIKDLLGGSPYIKEIKEFDRRKEKDGGNFVKWICDHKFDAAIQSFPADDYFSWVLPYLSCEVRRPLSVHSGWDKHEVDYNFDLSAGLYNEEFRIPRYEIPSQKSDRVEKLLSGDTPLVAICPSFKKEGMWWKKHWGTENYASLINLFPDGFRFVLLESAGGIDICNKIEFLVKDKYILNLAGELSIKETVAAIQMSDMVIANDSGPAHIAAAFEKPLIVFFGPTSVTKNQPISPQSIVLKINKCPFVMPCQGTEYWNKCAEPLCLATISPEMVMKVIEKNLLIKEEVNG